MIFYYIFNRSKYLYYRLIHLNNFIITAFVNQRDVVRVIKFAM